MSILFDTTIFHRRQVIVDDVHHIANINAPSRDASGNEDGGLAAPKGSHGCLSFDLGSVTVNGSDRELHVVEKVIESVGCLAAVDEDNGADPIHLLEEREQKFVLLLPGGLNNHLPDIHRRASSSTNSKAHMGRRQVLFGESTSSTRESGGKESVFDIAFVLLCIENPLVNCNNDKLREEITCLLQTEWGGVRPPNLGSASRRLHQSPCT